MGLRTLLRNLLPAGYRRDLEAARFARTTSYFQDGLCCIFNCDFMNDSRFAAAYQAGLSTGSWPDGRVHWRAMVACWAADIGLRLNGDFVECGVNKGGLAATVLTYTNLHKTGNHFWLVDTYEGLVADQITQSEREAGIENFAYDPCYDHVVRIFSPYGDCPRIIKGAVPDSLKLVSASRVAYLSIDMNCTLPEIAAATHFWPLMMSGAVIVLDDYGWPSHIEQKRAFDNFAKERGVPILPLPTGQAIIIKP